MTFVRPRIVDPNFKTAAGVRTLAKEEGELRRVRRRRRQSRRPPSAVPGVSRRAVSCAPSAWNIIVGQLQRRTAYAGEAAAVAGRAQSTAAVPARPAGPARGRRRSLFGGRTVHERAAAPTWIATARRGREGGRAGRRPASVVPRYGSDDAAARPAGWLDTGPARCSRRIVAPAVATGDMRVGGSRGHGGVFRAASRSRRPSSRRLRVAEVAVAEAHALHRPTTSEGDGTTRPERRARCASAPPPGLGSTTSDRSRGAAWFAGRRDGRRPPRPSRPPTRREEATAAGLRPASRVSFREAASRDGFRRAAAADPDPTVAAARFRPPGR